MTTYLHAARRGSRPALSSRLVDSCRAAKKSFGKFPRKASSEGDAEVMSDQHEEIELERGSDNVYRDFGEADADVLQAKARLAARIIGELDDRELSVRKAEKLTGFAASDFSRIRNADLGRFTIDRLIRILGALGQSVEIRLELSPRSTAADVNPPSIPQSRA